MKKIYALIFIFITFPQKKFLPSVVHSKLQFASKANNRVSVDSIYYYHFSAIDSSNNLFSFSVGTLPAWLHYSKDSNTISGRPMRAGQTLIDILATASDTIVHQRFMLTVYDDKTTNILILGNSITNGTNKYNSYRRPLWQLLHKGNYDFDFIGSWDKHHNGGEFPDPDFDMDHEGHSGWKASDILSQPDWDKQRGNMYEWIKNYKPGMVLMELGTNEVFQCVPDTEAINNISLIIDILRNKNPQVKIFLAQIPPLGAQWIDKKLCGNNISYGQAVINFNKAISAFATAKNTISSPVILVDQYSGINTATDMYDDIHPNDIGERKMAEKWYKAINKYLTKLNN